MTLLFTALAARSASQTMALDALIFFTLSSLVFAGVGALIVSRRPGNVIGWIFLYMGVYAAITSAGDYLADGLTVSGRAWLAWVGQWLWVPGYFSVVAYVPLLFPDGAVPSRRWRWVGWMTGLGMVLTTAFMALHPEEMMNDTGLRNPVGLESARGVLDVMGFLGAGLFASSSLASLGALGWRFRRSSGDERQQLKWFLFATVLLGVALTANFALRAAGDEIIGGIVVSLGLLCLSVAIGVAILRYRLYDIDVVINKTVVFAGLAGFITAVYVAIVVGVGGLVGSGDEPNLGLSVAATAVVAVAFGPVRERVQRVANRLVYGVRATPYEVLSAFSARLGDTVGSDQLLGRMARLLAQGTGAARARVWLRVGDTLRPAAAWPDHDDHAEPLTVTGQTLPVLPGADAVTPVVHHGDLLGALTVSKARGETLTPTDSKLIADLAAQAGLVLRNVRLTAELMDRLEELRASRQRLVVAQDTERRRLERDLHDGAQQQLVALKIKLGLAKTMAEREHAGKTAQVISGLAGDADDAITTLRDLARGIYPPLLADQGLPAALTAQAAKAPIPVTVHADGITRYPQDTEAAVYFSCLEALQNTAKYAHAGHATITLAHTDAQLTFTVTDDGDGFDPDTTTRGAGLVNITDRLDALGGTLAIESAPGAGTTLTGQLPVHAARTTATRDLVPGHTTS